MKHTVLVVVFVALAFALMPVQAQVANGGDRLVVNFSDPSRPGSLRVNWESGSVTVTAHSGKDVIIHTSAEDRGPRTPRRPGPTPNDSSMAVEEDNNVILITRGRGTPADLDIQVPVKTNLKLRGLNGRTFVAEGIEGEIEVSLTNGSVKLTNVVGSIIADTTNGNVSVALRDITRNRSISLASMNGNIDVTLPSSSKADLRMQAQNGEAISEFEILVRPTTPGENRAVRNRTTIGTINGGGTSLDLRALNGNIHLKKSN